jgi:hypothetical protein
MFGIEWLRNGVVIDRGITVIVDEAGAIANARNRAVEVAERHRDGPPDSFRLTDASGKIFGTFPISSRELAVERGRGFRETRIPRLRDLSVRRRRR